MAFVGLADGAKVCLNFAIPGGVAQICLSFKKQGYITTDLISLVQTMNGWGRLEVMPLLSNAVSLNSVIGRDIRVEFGAEEISTASLPLFGTFTNSLPLNCALVVTHRTAQVGRSYRGRSYVPGLAEANSDSDLMSLTWVADIVDAFADMATGYVNPIGWTHVVPSYVSNGAPRAAALGTPVTAYTADRIVDSQRRRLTGRGS